MRKYCLIVLALVVCLGAQNALALSVRVFVSNSGVDTSTCSRSAPCRSFAYAITQVSAGGEVVALDSAGYGPVTISQSVSIYAVPGASAAISTSGFGNGITVAAGATDSVVLKNLFVNGSGSGTYGIDFQTGHSVRVDDSEFFKFSLGGTVGINFERFGNNDVAYMTINHCVFEQNYYGVHVQEHGTTSVANVTVRNSTFNNNVDGLVLLDGTHAAVSDSTLSANSNEAVHVEAQALGYLTIVHLDRCTLSGNHTGASAVASTGLATLRLAYCMVTNNAHGLQQLTNGVIAGRADGSGNYTNTVEDNLADNTMPSTYAAK
jgi:hypothetical protein